MQWVASGRTFDTLSRAWLPVTQVELEPPGRAAPPRSARLAQHVRETVTHALAP
jgi:hypothetical protein